MSLSPSAAPPFHRCAARADARGDDMLGTAFPAARLLLVEQPHPWGPQGLRTSRFDPAVALAVEARFREVGVRVQAIRRLGRTAERTRRRWMLVDTRAGSRAVIGGDYGADADLLELPLDGSAGVPDPEPLYLVCTHGRHDPCCAQRGRPVALALTRERPERVWQASHLGGCRFAPTMLALPSGLMYGRVPVSAVPELVDATEHGRTVPSLLRGRIGMPPAAQAATAFAQTQLGLPRVDDVALVAVTARDGATVDVRLRAADALWDVEVGRTRVDADGLTCGAPGPSWFVAHRPRSIAPASA